MDKKLVTVATISAILGASSAAIVDAAAATETLLLPKRVVGFAVPKNNAQMVTVTSTIRTRAGLAASDVLDRFCVDYTLSATDAFVTPGVRQEVAVDTTISSAIKEFDGVVVKP